MKRPKRVKGISILIVSLSSIWYKSVDDFIVLFENKVRMPQNEKITSFNFNDFYKREDRQNAKYPRITQSPYQNNTTNTEYSNGFGPHSNSFWMHDTDYLRLKNIVIGYTLPSNLTRKAGISMARIYWSGQNLLTFSKLNFMDPESNYNNREEAYPLQKVYTFGINVTF